MLSGEVSARAPLRVAFSFPSNNSGLTYAGCEVRGLTSLQPGLLADLNTIPTNSHEPPRAFQGLAAGSRPSAHSTCSRTSGDESSRRERSAVTTSGEFGAFPSATAIFRSHRS